MAIFRTLVQTLSKVKSTLPRRRTFTVASSISLISFPTCPLSFSLSPHLAFYNSKFSLFKPLFPFHGPLFLSAQPYNLSQFSTPLYQQCDVVLRKVEAFHLLSHEQIHCKVESNNVPRNSGLTIFRVDVKKVQNDGKENFIEIFVNLPNLVSVSRMVSGPILGWMITNECYSYAFLGLAISGATDWLDGYLARKMRIDSVIGSYLDPLADKVLIGCVALAMVHKDLLHAGLVGTILLRDVFLIGGVFYKRASSLGWEWESWFDFFNIDRAHRQRVEPLYLSKVNTVLQLILIAAALLQPELGTERTQAIITYLSWLVASTTVASTAAYGAQHMRSSALSSRNR